MIATVSFSIQTAWVGVSFFVGTLAIRSTTDWPATTFPNTVYWAGSFGLSAVEMKNWLPPELGYPVLAIAIVYFL